MWLLIWVLVCSETIGESELMAGAGWVWEHLDLELDVSQPRQLTVKGSGTLRLEVGATRQMTFMLNSRERGMTLEEICVVGRSIQDLHRNIPSIREDGARLVGVFLDKEVAANTELQVAFTCRSSEASMQLVLRDDVAYASWVESWYPVPIRDEADLGFGTQVRIKGTTRFHMPPGWRGLTNGRRTAYDASNHSETWMDDQGLARSFVAAPFQVSEQQAGGKQIGVYLLSAKPLSAKKQAQRLSQAIDALATSFGPYPYETFAIAEIPNEIEDFGAASEQGFIVAKTLFFEAPDGNLPLFAHEAGHSWWGNVVTSEGGGGTKWCSESLAQYGAYLAIEAIEGSDAAANFLHFSTPSYVPSQCGRGYFGMVRVGKDRPLSASINEEWSHQLADSKGHWVYHMLRHQVGDEAFFTTMKALFQAFQERPLSMNAIRAFFVEHVPDADLDTFFAQWLDRSGAPIIHMRWWLAEEMVQSPWDESVQVPSYFVRHGLSAQTPMKVVVQLNQVQEVEPFSLPIELGIRTLQGELEVHQLSLTERTQQFEIEVKALPMSVDLDPNAKLLIWRPFYGPPPDTESPLSTARSGEQ